MGGFKGSNIQKSGKDGKTAGPIGTKLCAHNYADDPGNGAKVEKNWPCEMPGEAFYPGVK